MTYQLLIIDDEEHIREGLGDLVDWAALGFRVVAKLEDGQQALEWLDRTDIDVILSDIKMTRMSGLDLAKYVYEHCPRTRMVLISGYKEFELAKQAMSYNVIHYLLKPTKLPDIMLVFKEVKQRLDGERAQQEQLSRALRQTSELLPAIRKRLFRDMAAGRWNDAQEVEKLLLLTGVAANTSDFPCALVRLSFPLAESSVAGESVEKMIRSEHAQVAYTAIQTAARHLDLAAVDLQPGRTESDFDETVREHMDAVVLRIRSVLDAEARWEFLCRYASLREMVIARQRLSAEAAGGTSADSSSVSPDLAGSATDSAGPSDASFHSEPYPELEEHRKRFLSYVAVGNLEALPEQYAKWLGECAERRVPEPNVKHMLIELFSSLSSKLNAMEMPIEKLTNRAFSYETILRLDGCAAMLDWGGALLNDINAAAAKYTSAEPAVIQAAKDYVAERFNQEISMESAASHVYLSPDYFSRLFKQHTGTSFTDYVIETRMQKALEYLRNPQFKIYEVGSSVGYKNTKYFFKLFKKHTGYTPTEYRRRSVRKDTP